MKNFLLILGIFGITSISFTQDTSAADKIEASFDRSFGYYKSTFTYLFEIETEYKLLKLVDKDSQVVKTGKARQVQMPELEKGTYWMIQSKADGNTVADQFVID